MATPSKEGFTPVLEDLVESGKVSALQYDHLIPGSRIDGGVVVSKGSSIEHALAESPLYVCRSRAVDNCSNCILLNHGCKAPIKVVT
jgi:hypothetical protein